MSFPHSEFHIAHSAWSIMTPERWQKVEIILQDALDRPPQERGPFLDQACLKDHELRHEAASLIAAHEAAGDFIEQPALLIDAHVILDHRPAMNIGREIGAYRIWQFLGAGGMGEVYLAEDGRLKRRVALKLLPAYRASDDERLARFQREAQTASALNHPNILTIYEVGESEGIPFIAAEFIEGDTIQELILGTELYLAQILDIATQVLSGLAAAHAAGIVHRDIKPDNIMRRPDGLVKLLDFGVAKLLEPAAESEFGSPPLQTETGAIVGTVNYMSPEQARGLTIDERSDIWSFGIVLYQLITQHLPFVGATRVDTLVTILERDPEPLYPANDNQPPPELQSLSRLVTRTLQKNRADRYQTANELLEDLKVIRQELEGNGLDKQTVAQSLEQGTSISFSEHTETQLTYPRPVRQRFPLLAAIILLVAAVIAVAFGYKWFTLQKLDVTSVSKSEKSYVAMKESEQLDFIRSEEQRISAMMGDRPGELDEEALRSIKRYVDRYLSRNDNAIREPGKEDLQTIYKRALPYLPTIARSFAARKVPIIIGIYLPVVESEYRPCFENEIGAKGLFQFLPDTARHYGVAPDARCDVEQEAPAAASYIADQMAELGDDAESMTLVLLSYNRGPSWVRGTLRQLRDSQNYERTFWTLFSNRDRLDKSFQTEGAGYVPTFFAAAIIGENPRIFGLELEPLSSLANATLISANQPASLNTRNQN